MGRRQIETEARAAKRERSLAHKRRALWDRWRLWVRIKRDGRVLVDAIPAAPLLIGHIQHFDIGWRSRPANGAWFTSEGLEYGLKTKLDAVECLLQHMVEGVRG